VSMAQVMGSDDIPPVDDVLDGIADFMDRALTPPGGGDTEAVKIFVRKMVEAGKSRLARAQEGKLHGK
jgi:hypothetical protein